MYQNMRLLKDIVDNTPLPIAVYTGDELKIEMANTAMIQAWGKGEDVIGKNYLDVLPEIKNDDFFQQATSVLLAMNMASMRPWERKTLGR